MSTQLTIDLLLMHNDSPLSHEAAIDSIVRLIAEGYKVTFSLGNVSNYYGDGHLPAIHVLVERDGEWMSEATDISISEAMSEAYNMTPEAPQ